MEHLRGFGLGHRDGEEEGQRRKLQAVPGDEPDVSCDDICANKVCDDSVMPASVHACSGVLYVCMHGHHT